MFAWLAERVPVFWLMELDLNSLKGSAAPSSRFWSVHGFSMPLGSHSSFRGVAAAAKSCQARLFLLLLQSGSLNITSVPSITYLSLGSLLVFLFPCLALCCWLKLAM